MKWEEIARLGRELPGVEEGTSYGTPALKVGGKGIARLREDGAVVFMLESVDEQELLIEMKPKLYYITDHYRGWPAVLARPSALRPGECRERLEEAWRRKAPRKLVELHDQGARAPRAASQRARAR